MLPTHTWKQINDEYNVFDVLHEPSCVGILTNIFRQRPGVIRSWHPTHSVAAYGKDAWQSIPAGKSSMTRLVPGLAVTGSSTTGGLKSCSSAAVLTATPRFTG